MTTVPCGLQQFVGRQFQPEEMDTRITQQGDPASLLTCSNIPVSSDVRPLTSIYKTKQHKNPVWKNYIAESHIAPGHKRKKTNCQMDEWPPAHFQQGTACGYIRLLPGDQNGGVPNNPNS